MLYSYSNPTGACFSLPKLFEELKRMFYGIFWSGHNKSNVMEIMEAKLSLRQLPLLNINKFRQMWTQDGQSPYQVWPIVRNALCTDLRTNLSRSARIIKTIILSLFKT